jgi:hypothetical protein
VEEINTLVFVSWFKLNNFTRMFWLVSKTDRAPV